MLCKLFLETKHKGELAIITPDKKAKNSELTDLQIQAIKIIFIA